MRRTTFVASIMACVLIAGAGGVADASTFGKDGAAIPTVYFPGIGETIAVVRQSDGKVVVVGTTYGPVGSTIHATRLTAGGAVDETYGFQGRALVELPPDTSELHADDATIDAAGNIVVVATSKPLNNSQTPSIAVVRLLPSGGIDSSFGDAGMRRIAPPGFYDGTSATQVRIDSLNRIVIAGTASDWSHGFGIFLARLTPNGTLDTTYNAAGYAFFHSLCRSSFISMTLDPGDRIVALCSIQPGYAQPYGIVRLVPPGVLDTTFGVAGVIRTDLQGSVTADGSGRVLALGVEGGGGSPQLVRVSRWTVTGLPDFSFGDHGTSAIEVAGILNSSALGPIIIDSSGRVVASLNGSPAPTYQGAAIVIRFDDHGLLDSTFGGAGVVTLIHNLSPVRPPRMRVEANGDVTLVSGSDLTFVARLLANGSPDTTFNGTGSTTCACGVQRYASSSLVRQRDGKWVLGGFAMDSYDTMIAVRLLSSGALDASFGGTGFVRLDGGQPFVKGVATQVDSAGRIVMASRTGNQTYLVARYTGTGQLDPGFGGAGFGTYVDPSFGSVSGQGMAIDSTDAVYLAGNTVTRISTNGSVDTAYGNAGHATLPIVGPGYDYMAKPVLVDASERVLVAGSVFHASNPAIAVARFTTAGVLDSSFGNGGVASGPNSFPYVEAKAMAIDPAGRIVVAASTGDVSGPKLAVLRLLPNGLPDPAFGTAGYVVLSLPPSNGIPSMSIALRAGGRIAIASDWSVVQLMPDGSIDPDFNGGNRWTVGVTPASRKLSSPVVVDAAGEIYVGGNPLWGMAVVKLGDGKATRAAIASVNGGRNPVALMPFEVVLQAQDAAGSPQPVAQPTTMTLSQVSGVGTLSGNLTCTIPAGETLCHLLALRYDRRDSWLTWAVDATQGDALAAGQIQNLFVDATKAIVTIVSHSPNPSGYGVPVTLKVALDGPPGASRAPIGSVEVGEDPSISSGNGCYVSLPGPDSCTYTPTAVGATKLTARYSGDAAYGSGVSPSVKHVVVGAMTSTLPLENNAGAATATLSGGGSQCTFASLDALKWLVPAAPENAKFPFGAFRFALDGCDPGATVRVTITFPFAVPSGVFTYVALDAATGRWLPAASASIASSAVTFDVTDGGAGDLDQSRPGSIVHVGALAMALPDPAANPVPALSREMLALLVAMLLMAASLARTPIRRSRTLRRSPRSESRTPHR